MAIIIDGSSNSNESPKSQGRNSSFGGRDRINNIYVYVSPLVKGEDK